MRMRKTFRFMASAFLKLKTKFAFVLLLSLRTALFAQVGSVQLLSHIQFGFLIGSVLLSPPRGEGKNFTRPPPRSPSADSYPSTDACPTLCRRCGAAGPPPTSARIAHRETPRPPACAAGSRA